MGALRQPRCRPVARIMNLLLGETQVAEGPLRREPSFVNFAGSQSTAQNILPDDTGISETK